MHVCDLVQLAGLAAEESESIISQPIPINSREVQNYVRACQTRFSRWTEALDVLTSRGPSPSELDHLFTLIEEVLISEILTRVWTGIVAASERKHQSSEAGTCVKSVFVDHLEIRRRILRLLVEGHPVVATNSDTLNRLRRRVERWTDLLVGRMALACDVDGLAFDTMRATDFSTSFRRESTSHDWGTTWHLVMTSLKTSFYSHRQHGSPSFVENRQIASSVSHCLTSHIRHEQEQGPTLPWHIRLDQTTLETEELVQLLLRNEGTL